MKNLILTIIFVSTTLLSYSQDAKTITVTVDNVLNTKGKVSFSLHTETTFMKGKGIMNTETKIEGNKVTVTFENVKPGEYAIIVLHDENENNKMDFSQNGMPLEAYGTSNNVMSFGPPKFQDAKFAVAKENVKLNIRF